MNGKSTKNQDLKQETQNPLLQKPRPMQKRLVQKIMAALWGKRYYLKKIHFCFFTTDKHWVQHVTKIIARQKATKQVVFLASQNVFEALPQKNKLLSSLEHNRLNFFFIRIQQTFVMFKVYPEIQQCIHIKLENTYYFTHNPPKKYSKRLICSGEDSSTETYFFIKNIANHAQKSKRRYIGFARRQQVEANRLNVPHTINSKYNENGFIYFVSRIRCEQALNTPNRLQYYQSKNPFIENKKRFSFRDCIRQSYFQHVCMYTNIPNIYALHT
eukprot:TRINITY_DN14000_c2_g1_i1.p1 TRINITY_DN14000_c2_g1~~TRINITY_DN14000_c2_g1_i1.p1  ORF type:complete len:271 (+),score=-3.54 TRINITY_DN14000_c2_g1_i1:562-1374(+)